MPWPDEIVRSFQKVPINPSEADFHGPYNKLLSMLFPWDTDYTITWHHMPNSLEASNFILMYEVLLEDKPVFVFVLNHPKIFDTTLHVGTPTDKFDDVFRIYVVSHHCFVRVLY
jgi:hypothetical protein